MGGGDLQSGGSHPLQNIWDGGLKMYEKVDWVDHVVEKPNNYTLTQNEDGSYKIEAEPGEVLQQGTAVNAQNLNHMEEGIAQAHEGLENKFNKSGGDVTGNVNVGGKLNANGGFSAGGNHVEGVATPTENSHGANKDYVDKKHLGPVTATLGKALWQGASAPYAQTISVSGILASDVPHVGVVLSANADTAIAQKEAWNLVSDVDSGNGTLTFRCLEDKPEVNIPIVIEVNR